MKAYLSLTRLALPAATPLLAQAQAQTGGVRIGPPGPPDASAALDLSPNAAALDISQGTSQNSPGASLLRVLGNGNVGIGTIAPAYELDVTGDARVSGSLNLGLVTVSDTQPVSPGSQGSSPSGTRLLGGGEFRQFSASAVDITRNYSGPDPDNPTTAWPLYAQNSGTVARDVYITCNCARMQ